MIKSNLWSEVQNKDRSIAFLLASACIAAFTLVLMNVSSGLIGGFTSAIAIIMYNVFTTRIDGITYGIDESGFTLTQSFAANYK